MVVDKSKIKSPREISAYIARLDASANGRHGAGGGEIEEVQQRLLRTFKTDFTHSKTREERSVCSPCECH